MTKKKKQKNEEYIKWDNKCPFCNHTKLAKLFADEDMGYVCPVCGAGFKDNGLGEKIYAPEISMHLVNKAYKRNNEE